jgi:hypothetical protein
VTKEADGSIDVDVALSALDVLDEVWRTKGSDGTGNVRNIGPVTWLPVLGVEHDC